MAQIHDLENFVVDALEAVEFKLIRSREDIEDDTIKFHPAMAHQIFGENENIFGYKDLKVNIMYTAGSLQIYLGINYSQRVEDCNNDCIKSDNIIDIITSKFPNGCYFINIDEFVNTMEKSKDFKPFGEKITEYIVTDNDNNKQRCFEIYQCDCNTPKFTTFFQRLQTFVLWFVDAACYIDVDDPQWMYFVCYEKYKDNDGIYQYATVGYTTIYKYYAYPEHIRPRISQMLILPPFQKLGIGTKFIETIYQYFSHDENVIDITVEDPSEEFTRIRNFVDSKLCKNLPSFHKDHIKNGFTKEMVKEAKERYKINGKQCRKVYEILRLYYTNMNNDKDYKNYRLNVKNRLYMIIHKQFRDIERLKNAGIDVQWMLTKLPTHKERLEELDRNYKEIENEYLKIVEKLREID